MNFKLYDLFEVNFSNSTMDHHNVKLALHAGQMWLFSGAISYACQRSLERVPVPQMATCLLGVKRHQTGLLPLQRLCGSTGCDADADCDIVGGHHRHIHNNDNWSRLRYPGGHVDDIRLVCGDYQNGSMGECRW